MADAVPSLEDVLTATKAEMDEISSLGTVYTSFHDREDDEEFLLKGGFLPSASFDVFFVELAAAPNREGEAAGEIFVFYQGEIRYWSMRTNNADWSKAARQKAESVVAKLTGNPSVFRIGGQVQLQTGETVDIISHGESAIRGGENGDQKVYQTVLRFTVEARRWDTAASVPAEECTPESASCIIANRVFSGSHEIFEG